MLNFKQVAFAVLFISLPLSSFAQTSNLSKVRNYYEYDEKISSVVYVNVALNAASTGRCLSYTQVAMGPVNFGKVDALVQGAMGTDLEVNLHDYEVATHSTRMNIVAIDERGASLMDQECSFTFQVKDSDRQALIKISVNTPWFSPQFRAKINP